MPQVVELPPIGQDNRNALLALVKVCKELPPQGEPFREFRTRLRSAKLWDPERPLVLLRFLGVGGATIAPSGIISAIAVAGNDEAAAIPILERLWTLNPLLLKTIAELVGQRAHHKDEIYKILSSTAYEGLVPSRPALEIWLQIGLACGLLKSVGVAVTVGPNHGHIASLAQGFDVKEFLAEDRPEPDPVIPRVGEEDAAPGTPEAAAVETSIPVAAAAAVSPLPAVLRQLSLDQVPPARGRERAVPTTRFAAGFTDEVLADTAAKIGAWWTEAARPAIAYAPSDFKLDAEAWVERADEVIYRLAVGAALAFRLDRDRPAVIAAYDALDKANVLADLYQGTVPETLPTQVDARALMLASLAARRCAEVPDLASKLEGRANAGEAFAALDAALGRGLFRTELFWILDQLGRLGVVRYDDLGDFTTTPHRIVRDTLFRLGFVATPYANDAAALAIAAKAARRAVPTGAADEVLATFALSAGCAYDCAHRKTCDLPCRERLE